MSSKLVLLVLAVACSVRCSPLGQDKEYTEESSDHRMRRFVNADITVGDFSSSLIDKMRVKRSYEDCERLQLCRLHARSQRNFLAAFELYFVNKENARLWDHQTHSAGDCARRYSCYR